MTAKYSGYMVSCVCNWYNCTMDEIGLYVYTWWVTSRKQCCIVQNIDGEDFDVLDGFQLESQFTIKNLKSITAFTGEL